MSKYARQKWKKCLNASMLVFMVASMFYFRLPSLAYNWFQIAWLTPEACRVSLWLSGYQAIRPLCKRKELRECQEIYLD
ncbi:MULTISPECIES: hypothetical protein [Delftia]|uniref:Uncharacterized protein n=1 Tax=Delftia deserti TaxID=1651218 RepID=A0ABW5EQD3_9BURK|nr:MULTISPECIES: hypothetical protein [Delftia]MDH0421473.1 hypothetical protein [Delftia tsuruhatensis]MDH2230965.1 hypothetical protein [Delftia tsuruhatensis]WAT88695.1 hypothetical protein O1V13_03895 [Delftia acidovorans]WON92141.1 hypothetical protein OK021_09770 [Delftia sp. UGAL515B_04]